MGFSSVSHCEMWCRAEPRTPTKDLQKEQPCKALSSQWIGWMGAFSAHPLESTATPVPNPTPPEMPEDPANWAGLFAQTSGKYPLARKRNYCCSPRTSAVWFLACLHSAFCLKSSPLALAFHPPTQPCSQHSQTC